MDLFNFFNIIEELKHSERQGWKDKEVERPRDTIASHSLGASLLGWVLAEKEDLDSNKIVKMLIMHDLIMAYIEDYTPKDQEFDSKKEMERKAFDKLVEDVPEVIRDEFTSLFQELQDQETDEAKLAKEADKLDTLLQARSYNQESDEEFLQEFLESYRDYFSSETGESMLGELENRGGDWNR